MSGQDFENMAVVGQVADIVHAFKEAGSYLKRIKERRRSKPPPRGLIIDGKALQDLEFSITTGQDTVRKHYERDYRRLGQPFATGDRQATEQLKAILLELQKSLVADLKFAYQHDQHIDFLPLQDVAADCQDQAVMCMMHLHQRVIMDVGMDGITNNKPYSRRQAVQRQTDSAAPVSHPGQMPDAFSPEIVLPPSRVASDQLPTPDQSPSYEAPEFMRIGQSNQNNNPFRRRAKPIELDPETKQMHMNTLLTPPLDVIGPPPTGDLPPLPKDLPERRRRDRKTRQEEARETDSPTKETQTVKTFLDRAFDEVERRWEDVEPSHEEDQRRQQQQQQQQQHHHHHQYRHQQQQHYQQEPQSNFVEPHPGRRVDPSEINEPVSPQLSPMPADISSFPSPPTPRRAPVITSSVPALRVPSRGDNGFAPDRPYTSSGSIGGQDHRLSVYSTATQSSQGGSSVSPSTRTSVTSAASWGLSPHASRQGSEMQSASPPSFPNPGVPMRSGSTKISDPIYESNELTESQSTLMPQISRRPSGPETGAQQSPRGNFNIFPALQPRAVIESQQTLTRRQSAFSMRSANSAAASAKSTIMPVRTLPPVVLDSNNQKVLLPSDTNKYGGLCKSAWRAQIGDFKKAYSAERRPGGVASGRTIDYMKCKNCMFSGGVIDQGKKKVPDRKIILSKDSGIAYRWDFLFKSHLPLKGGFKSADAEYGCMFCCAEGRGTPIFKGMATFIAHVAEHRPGVAGSAANNDLQVPAGAVVDRMDALVGRIMELDDRWEIAFPTASGDGAYSESVSAGLASGLASPTDAASLRSGATSRAMSRAY